MKRLIGRTLRGCPSKVKETAYFSLIRPSLKYRCAVWNPHEVGLVSDLEMVQHRAARFVNGNFRFDSSVTAMIESLGWNSLHGRRSDYRRKLFEKFNGPEFLDEVRDIVIPINSERDLREATAKRYKEIIAIGSFQDVDLATLDSAGTTGLAGPAGSNCEEIGQLRFADLGTVRALILCNVTNSVKA